MNGALEYTMDERGQLARAYEGLSSVHRQTRSGAMAPVAAGAIDTLLAWGDGASPATIAVEAPPTWLDSAMDRSGLTEFGFDSADDESVQGAIVLLRGVAGELVVAERLADGSIAGPSGSAAGELLAFASPGADIRFEIEGRDALANVKITDDADLIVQHFASHPDVPVVFASSDAARSAADRGMTVVDSTEGFSWPTEGTLVVDIGVRSDELEKVLRSALTAMDMSPGLLTSLPLATIATVIWRAARSIRDGSRPLTVLRRAGIDTASGAAALTLGRLLGSAGASEPVSAIGVLIGSALWRSTVGVRKSWNTASAGDLALAARAESIAQR